MDVRIDIGTVRDATAFVVATYGADGWITDWRYATPALLAFLSHPFMGVPR